jgi:Co/Zn/Cd efflux system component
MDHPVVEEIREVLSSENDSNSTRVTDLHVWRVGKNAYACSISLVTKDQTLTPAAIKQQLSVHDEIVHTTIEIHRI